MDQMSVDLLLGVAANALTGVLSALARSSVRVAIGTQLVARIEEGKASIRPVLKSAIDEFSRVTPLSGPEREEEIALFLLSPEVEAVMRQLYCAELAGRSGAGRFEDARREFTVSLAARLSIEPQRAAPGASLLFDGLLATCERMLQIAVEKGSLSAHEARSALRYSLVSDELANIERNLELLLKDSPDVKAILRFEQQLRKQIAERHSYIIPPHFDSLTKVPIEDIYVAPAFESLSTRKGEEHRTCEMEEFLSSTYRRAVLGDPGCGKSTFAAKLSHDLSLDPGRRLLMGRVLTPVLVILREYGAEKKDRRSSLLSFMEAQAETRYMVQPPAKAFEYLFLSGRAVVIFDGLDELLETSHRLEISADIEAFCARYPAVPVLVTSRTVGYEEAPLDPRRFSAFRISPFDEERVRAYVRKWSAIGGDLAEKQRDQYVKSFLLESGKVADLRSNPLMLALMCNLYRGAGYIPRNRPDVYEKCATMLFERWDKSRGINAALPFEAHVRPAMMFLAHWIYGDTKLQQGVTEAVLVGKATEYLTEHRFEDTDEATHAAREFTSFCTGRAWVFTDTGTTPAGDKLFQFTHRTFLEYFAAGHLVRTHPTPAQLLALLLPHLKSREWDAVAQLAVQIQNRNVEGAADALLEGIVDTACEDKGSRANLLDFAARSLEFLVPMPKTVRKVVEACVSEAVPRFVGSSRADWDSRLLRLGPIPVGSALSCAEENVRTVRRALAESLLERIRGAEREEAIGAELVALALPRLAQVATGSADSQKLWRKALEDVWAQSEPEGNAMAREEFAVGFLALESGHMSLEQFAEAHGAGALYRGLILSGLLFESIADRLLVFGLGIETADRLLVFGQGIETKEEVDPCAHMLAELGRIGEALPRPWILTSATRGLFKSFRRVTERAMRRPAMVLRGFRLLVEQEAPASTDPAEAFGLFQLLAVQAELRKAKWVERENLIRNTARVGGPMFSDLWLCITARFVPRDQASLDSALDGLGLVGRQRDFVWRWIRGEVSFVG